MIREIGTRRELFVDDWLLARLDNATLRLHHPTPREVALPLDAPWEGPGSHYVTVLTVDGEHRMYYRAGSPDGTETTGVATSTDGIHWQRPTLNVIEWHGSTANNLVWQGKTAQNFTPFVDANPAATPEQRFKAVGSEPEDGNRVLRGFVSPDGYRWQLLRPEPIITDGYFDSQNLIFWDPQRGEYVAFYRDFRDDAGNAVRPVSGGIRSIRTSTTQDFGQWPTGDWVNFGDSPLEQFYTNATVSYYRAPHIYLSFPKRFMATRKRIAEHGSDGLSDGVMMSSRDGGVTWDRPFMEAFLRPGLDPRNWTDRNNGFAWGMIQTAPDELSMYWIENYKWPTNRVRRGTLRLDGFASLNGPYAGGEAVTHPLTFSGKELEINFATSAVGSVRVEIQDEQGAPIPGFSLAESAELYGDAIEERVTWQGGAEVASLAGRPVRLRFVLHDADIYSLRFKE